MNKENLANMKKRIIARGEFSNHSHVLFGNVEFLEKCFKITESKDYDKALALYNEYNDKLPSVKDNPVEKKVLQETYNKTIESLDVATIRHIYESNYLSTGEATWTGEHVHSPMKNGTYEYDPQVEFNPLNEEIERVRD